MFARLISVVNGLPLKSILTGIGVLLAAGWGAHEYLYSTFLTVQAGEKIQSDVQRSTTELKVMVLRLQLKLLQAERFQLLLKQTDGGGLTQLERQRLDALNDEIAFITDEIRRTLPQP